MMEQEKKISMLTSKAKALWITVFERAKEQTMSEAKASQVAWNAVKRKYLQTLADRWVVSRGFVTSKEIILRNFEADGDFFFEGYVTSFEPDDGDLQGKESIRVSPTLGPEIARLLEELQIGGGIEHDTNETSEKFNPDADKVFSVVKAESDEYGVKALMKISKESKRFAYAKDAVKRGILGALSLEILPATHGYSLENVDGRIVKTLNKIARVDGVSLARKGLDNRARIKKHYEVRRKGRNDRDGRSKESKRS